MKTSEFEKIVRQNGYCVSSDGYVTQVLRNNDFVLAEIYISECGEYGIWDAPSPIAKAVVDYATTPIEERNDKKRWNVILSCDNGISLFGGYTAWYKFQGEFRVETGATDVNLQKDKNFIFSDSEFAALIVWLKKLPDGETYAKIAELGKQEVNE